MLNRSFPGLAVAALLAACQPTQPEDSRFGEGFDRTFDAQLVNKPAQDPIAAPTPSTSAIGTAPDRATDDAAAIAAETTAQLDATRANSGVPPVEASPSNPPPPVVDSATGISRENNFDAVSNTRTRQSDAARIAANRAQYQVIQPEAVPDRTETGPNIVAYALQTSHPVGTQIYKRFSLAAASKYNRNCGRYKHQDQAQIDFLSAGGPERDPRGMDPDGDGYACTWDPAPYRGASSE